LAYVERVRLLRCVALITILTLLATPLGTEAQQAGKVARVGMLLYSTPTTDPNVAAFIEGLRDLGYREGQTLAIDYRSANGRPERLPELAADLVRLRPDVIIAPGGDVAPAAQQATRTIPIVTWVSNDPVQAGLVASLARPGGNITGVTLILDELAGKRLALLKEAATRVARVGIIWSPDHADPEFRECQRAALALGMQLQSLEVRRAEDFDPAFQLATRERSEALVVVSSRLVNLQRQRILDFAARNRITLVGDWGPWAQDGALLSYGPNVSELSRRAASYVDRILRGARPADLPVQQPTRSEMAINLRTARALGLAIPPSLLLRAGEVIQ
jgi:putative ABC transport system substrate-binding protein